MSDYSPISKPDVKTGAIRQALVIEDTPAFQELIREAISELGVEWQAHCVPTGAEAQALIDCQGFGPELILVDLGLPDMSGIDVIRSAHRRLPETPIMVISMIASNDSVIKAIQAGAKGYVQKGDSTLSITQAMSRVLEGDYPISPSLAQYLFKLVAQGSPDLVEVESPLTEKEMMVLKLLGQGYTYAEVATELHNSISTIQHHVKNIYLKLEVHSRARAIAKAQCQGWI